jgi:uncharacterized membrane protein YeaQ/YmgE (transglycosylase-associated protein family)
MERKTLIRIGVIVGSVAGGYIPALWGADFLSLSSIVFSALGAFLGIYVGFKLGSD